MKLRRVESAMLKAAGYDARLEVWKLSLTRVADIVTKRVPPFEYDGLMTAESIGKYMHKRIIGRYRYDVFRRDYGIFRIHMISCKSC